MCLPICVKSLSLVRFPDNWDGRGEDRGVNFSDWAFSDVVRVQCNVPFRSCTWFCFAKTWHQHSFLHSCSNHLFVLECVSINFLFLHNWHLALVITQHLTPQHKSLINPAWPFRVIYNTDQSRTGKCKMVYDPVDLICGSVRSHTYIHTYLQQPAGAAS